MIYVISMTYVMSLSLPYDLPAANKLCFDRPGWSMQEYPAPPYDDGECIT